MIVGSAIKTNDGKVWVVPRPGRHHNVFEEIRRFLGIPENDSVPYEEWKKRWYDYMHGHVSGFVDETGSFFDRVDSLAHVETCGQPFRPGRMRPATKREIPDNEIIGSLLTSEDLW